MVGTKLLLTRHGQTEWNLERRLQGRYDAPLTELGVFQAVSFGDHLGKREIDVVYVSPTDRTRKTAELALQGRVVPVIESDDLREMDLGPWQGQCIDEVPDRWPEEHHLFWNRPEEYTPPGPNPGETFDDLRSRAQRVMESITSSHPGRQVLVVTHSLVIKAMWLAATERPVSEMWVGEEIAGGSLTELERTPEGWQVLKLGEAPPPARQEVSAS